MATPLKALFLDLSGVLYDGDRVIDGAREAVTAARERKLTLRFVTNTATKHRDAVLSKLRDMGFALQPEELFTAPDAALAYIRERQLSPYGLGG